MTVLSFPSKGTSNAGSFLDSGARLLWSPWKWDQTACILQTLSKRGVIRYSGSSSSCSLQIVQRKFGPVWYWDYCLQWSVKESFWFSSLNSSFEMVQMKLAYHRTHWISLQGCCACQRVAKCYSRLFRLSESDSLMCCLPSAPHPLSLPNQTRLHGPLVTLPPRLSKLASARKFCLLPPYLSSSTKNTVSGQAAVDLQLCRGLRNSRLIEIGFWGMVIPTGRKPSAGSCGDIQLDFWVSGWGSCIGKMWSHSWMCAQDNWA